MAKRQPPTPQLCDFDNVFTSPEDETNIMRKAQKDLYRLDNPYVGNKRKIVVDIAKSLDKVGVQFDTIADVFSGSSVVGLFFKLMGKKVRSNDLLTSSYMNALVFVENNGIALDAEDVDFLANNDNAAKLDFVRTFYGERFTDREALYLDNYKANAHELFVRKWCRGNVIGPNRTADILFAIAMVSMEHHIMNRCFLGGRLNSGQILAKLEHRLQHQRNLGHEMSFKLEELPVFPGEGCEASNKDCLEFLDSIPAVDLCYLDPPYGGAQSDYASMFAFARNTFTATP
jgi:adenine-specific DNA-methyltransferase